METHAFRGAPGSGCACGAAGPPVGHALGGSPALLGPASRRRRRQPATGLDPARMIDATHVPPLITVAGRGRDAALRRLLPAAGRRRHATSATAPARCTYERAAPARFARFRSSSTARRPTGATRCGSRTRSRLRRPASRTTPCCAIARPGATTTLPPGGAAAPQRSYRAAAPVDVELGAHRFGTARAPSKRVLDVPWGDGQAEAGLEGGPGSTPVGPGAFAVAADGTVTLARPGAPASARARGRARRPRRPCRSQ